MNDDNTYADNEFWMRVESYLIKNHPLIWNEVIQSITNEDLCNRALDIEKEANEHKIPIYSNDVTKGYFKYGTFSGA